jgi:hypothetical protein
MWQRQRESEPSSPWRDVLAQFGPVVADAAAKKKGSAVSRAALS